MTQRQTIRTGPLIFAHRGASVAFAEHTLPAYLQALEEGADGLECDVRLTRDGQLVCLHDRRLERTSNGRGLVGDFTLAELEQLDFGSWHGTGPASVLTLERLLTVAHQAARPVQLLIETKHPSRSGPLLEQRLVELLRRHGLTNPGIHPLVQVTVMSFAPLALRRVRRLAPALATAQLLELLAPGMRLGRPPLGTMIAGPSIALVRARPALVPALRAAGTRVYVWTVNEAADIDLVSAQGVDGIITDQPAAVRKHLAG